jgi:hypothetical protein
MLMPCRITEQTWHCGRRVRFILSLGAVFLSSSASRAADVPSARPAVDFERDIRPILTRHCSACHGPDEHARKAGLRLDRRDVALAKKAIVPGNPKASKLIERIEAADEIQRMPPAESKRPLDERQRKLLRAWIEQGAAYAQHWAFVPPQRPAVPEVKDAHWPRNSIDAFVLQRLEREGVRPSPEADPATLLRRVSLDLTGLPPSVTELAAFLRASAANSPAAYEAAIDRLLASPGYTERMAMAWLDAARYADTNGFNNDEDRTQWPWRDWVIEAFRNNTPYDRFIVEQLAGDLLPKPTLQQKVATAFHRNQVYNTEGGIIPEEYRVEYVADRVHTTATVFLGLSMQCARCHDHKYDPISQREYYQFFAFFNGVVDRPTHAINLAKGEPFVRVPSPEQLARIEKLERQRIEQEARLKQHEAGIDTAMTRWEKGLTPEEIKKHSTLGLLLHVPLDETAGDAVHDAAKTRVGAVRGKAIWGAGKVGGALEFDGNTHVEIANAPNFEGDSPFSISVWAHPSAAGSVALLSKMDDAAAYRGYDLLLENGKVVMHLVHHWADNAIKVSGKSELSPNAWHHVLVTYNGSRKAAGLELFVDGKPEALEVLNDSLKDTIRTDKPMHLGKRRSSLPFKGKLDDIRLYGVKLSAENAAQLAAGQQVNVASNLLAVAADKRTPAQQAAVRRFYLDRIDTEFARLKAELAETSRQKNGVEKAIPALMVMQDQPNPRDTFLLKRGQYDQPGEKVASGVPAVLPPLPEGAPHNRLGLAKWLVHSSNPLTARVAVNRCWQMYFGTGLVKTVEDFGVTGEAPSHPELLDWLATELIRSSWDVKAMQKLIVCSATYRQSSRSTKEMNERDPENRLLARGPRNRLSAETVRDNALAISGLLKEKVGGPSVKPYQPQGLWEDVTVDRRGRYVQEKGDGLYRRSMYTFWKRTCPPPALMSFDAPNREVCVARRATTNTPLQALVLLNDPTYVEAARKLAERTLKDGGKTPEDRLDFAFRCAVSRTPDAGERRILLSIHDASLRRFRGDKEAANKLLAIGDSPRDTALDESELAAWTTVASTILNLDETISKR